MYNLLLCIICYFDILASVDRITPLNYSGKLVTVKEHVITLIFVIKYSTFAFLRLYKKNEKQRARKKQAKFDSLINKFKLDPPFLFYFYYFWLLHVKNLSLAYNKQGKS